MIRRTRDCSGCKSCALQMFWLTYFMVNVYEVKAAWCICSVKSCVIHAERFRGELLSMGRYTNLSTFTFTFTYLHTLYTNTDGRMELLTIICPPRLLAAEIIIIIIIIIITAIVGFLNRLRRTDSWRDASSKKQNGQVHIIIVIVVIFRMAQ